MGSESETQTLAMLNQKLWPIHLMKETLLHSATPEDSIPDWALGEGGMIFSQAMQRYARSTDFLDERFRSAPEAFPNPEGPNDIVQRYQERSGKSP